MIENSSVDRSVIVVLRYDDYGGPAPCPADQAVIAAALRHNIRFTFGVIPAWHGQPLGATTVQALLPALQQGIIELAQHGYTHDALWQWRGRSSEFLGLPFADQSRRIAAGKAMLEKTFGQRVSSFIPPWNRYDDATVACLEQLGFDTLSGDNRFPGWTASRLKGMPVTCELRDLKAVVNSAQVRGLKNALVVCLFHRYDFREMDSKQGWLNFYEFNTLMQWLAAQPGVETLTVHEAAQRFPHITGDYQRQVCRWLACENLLPAGWRIPMPELCVYPGLERVRQLARSATLKLAVFNLAVFAGAAAIAWGLSKFVHDHSYSLSTCGAVMSLGVLLLAAIYAFRDRAFTTRRMIVFAVASGAALGWFGAKGFHG
jgi:peptidoglycan/xylan/chitin deacetylase (PgdA/CDA1 family)